MTKGHKYIPLPLPFDLLRNLSGVNPLIVNYHVVSDERLPHVENLYKYRDVSTFAKDLDFFCRKYNPIGLEELLSSLKNASPLPPHSVLLTFDDGFREVHEIVAPILVDRKLTATVFLTSNFIDNKALNHDNKKSLIIDHLKRYGSGQKTNKMASMLSLKDSDQEALITAILDVSYKKRSLIDELAEAVGLDFPAFLTDKKPYLTSVQIRELIGAGFTIGSHSLDHAPYAELSVTDQVHQTISSTDRVTGKFGLSYRVFAFPYHDLHITRGFFDLIGDRIDASFGTLGLLKDEAPRNFQRISVEKSDANACRTVSYQYRRKVLLHMFKKDIIRRSLIA